MRLGKWLRVFHNTIPIPLTFSASFGLRQGSRLYLAPIPTDSTRKGGDAEIIISPIPIASWRSVCRLSVRLHDNPRALATAAEFLRERRINILLTEAAATFQERAHWDAVCDLIACPEFAALRNLPYDAYEIEMRRLLQQLTTDLHQLAGTPSHRHVFLSGQDMHADFSIISGLNIASFKANLVPNYTTVFSGGGIDLPETLVREIRTMLGSYGGLIAPIPSHALITGNTEQRYLRLYFIRNVDEFVMTEIECHLDGVAGGGVGVLGQILSALPPELNLLQLGIHRVQRDVATDAWIVKTIGHWQKHDEDHLRKTIDAIEIMDMDGISHPSLCKVSDFATPHLVHPRVYISYSSVTDSLKLRILRNALMENNFDPVVGTDIGDAPLVGGGRVPADVLSSALEHIPTCIAFISLQTKREDFCQSENRFTLPPWIVAEEVFAFSRGAYFLARLRERGVEDPRYNKNAYEYHFLGDHEYEVRVAELMQHLNEARQNSRFNSALKIARQAQYRTRMPPD